MYPTIFVTQLFNISRETVRTWAEEFAAYLSPIANPGGGRARQFTDEDLTVLALIADLKKQGRLYSDIHAALANGQRGDLPAGAARAMIPAERGRAVILAREVERLQSELSEALKDNERQRGQIDLLTQQLEAAQREIKTLNREIGRLEVDRDTD